MSARKLHVSPDLLLPPDVVTSTLVIYGGKGMGKTNFGSVLVEELAAAHLRFSVLDPMGVWWGLRHSEDGKGPGIEVLILGGIHGDIPIEPTAGAVVGDLVVDEAANVVIDISRRPDGTMWSIGERVRFVTEYCKRLYQRQGEQRRPLMQVIDEAARFIPQMIRKGEEQVAACMGAVAVLVEEGRNVGIGVCLITQRSARLNKDVAELADGMVAFRTVGPNSRRAVLDWLGEHVEKERLKEFDTRVRALPRGTALVVSPGWLEYEGVVPMRPRQTFDSSATPKSGQERRASGPGAKPDLAKYRERMAATIEKAKAEDPRELRRRIAELEAESRKARATAAPVQTSATTTGMAELRTAFRQADADRQRLARHASELTQAVERLMKFIVEINAQDFFKAGGAAVDQNAVQKALDAAAQQLLRLVEQDLVARRKAFERWRREGEQILAQISRLVKQDVKLTVAVKHNEPFTVTPAAARIARRLPPPVDGEFVVGNVEQKILDQLAELAAIGIEPADKVQVGFFCGYTNIRSGGFSEPIGRLVKAGLIESPQSGTLALTDAGRAQAQPSDVPATTEALQQRILTKLDGPRSKLLAALLAIYPEPISKQDLGERLGYTNIRSGGFSEPMGSLSSLGFVESPAKGTVRASGRCFLNGGAR